MPTLEESPEQVRGLSLRARTAFLQRRFAVHPRKSLGQNFLVNAGAAERLAAAALEPSLPLLEIGGGLGALTVPLARAGLPLTVYEIDRALAEALAWLFSDLQHVTVHAEDILTADFAAWEEGPAVAVGNLPYLSAGAILQKLWAPEAPFRRLVVTVQREVADRLRAQPGIKAWGPLSVLAQAHTERPAVLTDLGPGSFLPAPRVSSTGLLLEKRDALPEGADDPVLLNLALRAAFGTRRKTLLNSLRAVLRLDSAAGEAVLREAGLDPGRRGETLSLGELLTLGRVLRQEVC